MSILTCLSDRKRQANDARNWTRSRRGIEPGLRVGSWEYTDGTKDEDGQEVYFKGFPSKDDYPEKDGWRDKEEYYKQLERWHDRWGTEGRLLQYSGASRRRKKEMRRWMEAFFSEMTKEHLQGRYKRSLYTYGLQPRVINSRKNWMRSHKRMTAAARLRRRGARQGQRHSAVQTRG